MFYINTLTVTNLTTLADLLARAPEPKDDNTNLRVPIWGRRFGGFLKNIKQDIQSPRTQKEPHKLKGPDLGKAFLRLPRTNNIHIRVKGAVDRELGGKYIGKQKQIFDC